jgi:hypothetical protein
MNKMLLIVVSFILVACLPAFAYQSLQQIFLEADGQGEYDKYIELDPDIEYLGDLRIEPGFNVYLDGNGAYIYAQSGSMLQIGVRGSKLDIQNCVMIGGLCGIYSVNEGSGTFKNNTIIGCTDAGIKSLYPNSVAGCYIYDNIITDCMDGLYCVEGEHPQYIGYNTIYNVSRYRYAEFCPS